LFHEGEEMLEGFLIGTALFGRELTGALVQLRGHLDGFPGGATEGDQYLGELGKFGGFHGGN
jgi:hypothetical protein